MTDHEEVDVWSAWYERARKMTLAELPAFIDEMAESGRSYSTTAEATGAAAVATAWALCHRFGLTGFQGGWVMWKFMEHWNEVGKDGPARLVSYRNLLYPQYEDSFRCVKPDVWEWAQEEAKKKVAEQDAKPTLMSQIVYDHWCSVAAGDIPFGLRVCK